MKDLNVTKAIVLLIFTKLWHNFIRIYCSPKSTTVITREQQII